MKNILNETDFLEISGRVQRLSNKNTRLWGNMETQQMLMHCATQLKLALGEDSQKQQGHALMRTKLGKWLLFSNIPWPKGAETPAEMNAELASFSLAGMENGKRELLTYLEKVRVQSQLRAHPFFGELSRKEWGRLIYKHLDHHLRQFDSR